MTCCILADPSQDRPDGHVAFPSLHPQKTESEPEGADAAPRSHDVTLVQFFQLRNTRAVVRDDAVDRAIEQGLPERLAVCGVTDRRAAFEFGTSVGNRV